MSDAAVSFDILARDQLDHVLQQLTNTARKLSGDIKSLAGTTKAMGEQMRSSEQAARILGTDLQHTGTEAEQAADHLGHTGRSSRDAAAQMREAGNRAQGAGNQLRVVGERAQETAQRVKSSGMAMASFVGNLAANSIATLTNMVVQAGKAVVSLSIGTAAANQTAAVSFELLLGGAKKAQKFLQDLQKFAAATPFDLPTLKDAASRLLAVGVNAKDVIPLMTRLGDSTAGMGTGAEGIQRAVYALQQMKQAGRASLDDINQLTDAGIPALDALAAHFHTTVASVRDMISKGKIKASDVFSAIESGEGPAFARLKGMMDKQSATLEGVWSTFKDNVSQSLGKAFDPMIPAMTKAVNWAAVKVPEAIQKAQDSYRRLADWVKHSDFMKQIGELASKFHFGDMFQGIRQDWNKFVQTVKDHKTEIKMALVAISVVILSIVEGILLATRVTLQLASLGVRAFAAFVQGMRTALNFVLGWVQTVAGLAAKIPGPWQSAFRDIADGAKTAKDRINGELDRVNKTIKIKAMIDIVTAVSSVGAAALAALGGSQTLRHRAKGGPTPSGPVLVGEEGPELLYLNSPGNVVPARQTAAALTSGVGESRPHELRVTGGSGTLAVLIKQMIRAGEITLYDSTGQVVRAA